MGVKTLRTQDTSDVRHFGTGAEVCVKHFYSILFYSALRGPGGSSPPEADVVFVFKTLIFSAPATVLHQMM